MPRTGFLPEVVPETHMDDAQAQARARDLRDLVNNYDLSTVVMTMLRVANDFRTSAAAVASLYQTMRPYGVTHDTAEKLLDNYPFLIEEIMSRSLPFTFDDTSVRQEVKTFINGLLSNIYTVDHLNHLRLPEAIKSPRTFFKWLRAAVEHIVTAYSEYDADNIAVEVANVDVPTDEPFRCTFAIRHGKYEGTYQFTMPWFGRQVIRWAPEEFVLLLAISVHGALDR